MSTEKHSKQKLDKVFGSVVGGFTKAGHKVDQGFYRMVDKSAEVATKALDPSKWKRNKSQDIPVGDLPPESSLHVWGGVSGRRWKTYFCVLNASSGQLECFKRKSRQGHYWSIDLHEATVFEQPGSKRQFKVASVNGPYCFKAASKKARTEWVEAIQAAILQAVETKRSSMSKVQLKETLEEEQMAAAQTDQRIHKLVDARMKLRVSELTPFLRELEGDLSDVAPAFEGSVEQWLATPNASKPEVPRKPGLTKSDSFASALSEIDDDGKELSDSWQALLYALKGVLSKEVYRLVELEEENLALRKAFRMSMTKDNGRVMGEAHGRELKDSQTEVLFGDTEEEELRNDVEDDPVVPGGVSPPSIDEEDTESTCSKTPTQEAAVSDVVTVSSRTALPVDQPTDRGFSIWSVLRNAIGKDLSRITLPATINEPLSALQRIAEELEYRHLLDQAAASPLSSERLMYVAVFAVSSYSSAILRANKPFNPLLGETYEWKAPDASCKLVAEQVSHHPPISCFWAEGGSGGATYQFYGEAEMRSKFWGKSIEMKPAGTCFLKLPGFTEEYSWNKATTSINNIILGKMWVEWSGNIIIRNRTTGEWAQLTLPRCRGQLDRRGIVEGTVYNSVGDAVYTISGSYMHSLFVQLTQEAAKSRGVPAHPECVYTHHPLPPRHHQQYEMTKMAVTLNEMPPGMKDILPPTDSRFRTDQAALEGGRWDEATEEKLRLEEKQRTVRRLRKEGNVEYHPAWFDFSHSASKGSLVSEESDDTQPCWTWNGKYWNRNWDKCYDLYSNNPPRI